MASQSGRKMLPWSVREYFDLRGLLGRRICSTGPLGFEPPTLFESHFGSDCVPSSARIAIKLGVSESGHASREPKT
jgi:hypothetical protein